MSLTQFRIAASRQTAGSLKSLDYGLYAVKGTVYLATEDELKSFEELEGLLSSAFSKKTLGEALTYVLDPGVQYEWDITPTGGKNAASLVRKLYLPGGNVYFGWSHNVSDDSVFVMVSGAVKPIDKSVDRPGKFFEKLPKFANLISGTKQVSTSYGGDFGLWQRAKDEFVLYLGSHD